MRHGDDEHEDEHEDDDRCDRLELLLGVGRFGWYGAGGGAGWAELDPLASSISDRSYLTSNPSDESS